MVWVSSFSGGIVPSNKYEKLRSGWGKANWNTIFVVFLECVIWAPYSKNPPYFLNVHKDIILNERRALSFFNQPGKPEFRTMNQTYTRFYTLKARSENSEE